MTPPPQPAPTMWYHRPISVIAVTLVIGGLLSAGLLAILFGMGDSTGGQTQGPIADVRMDGCTDTEYGAPKALLHVTNSTDHVADYRITVVFERSGTQVGSGFATVVDLNPGQGADAEAVGFGTGTGGSMRCRVSGVERR